MKTEPPVESPTQLFSSSDSELEGKLDYSSVDSLDSQSRNKKKPFEAGINGEQTISNQTGCYVAAIRA